MMKMFLGLIKDGNAEDLVGFFNFLIKKIKLLVIILGGLTSRHFLNKKWRKKKDLLVHVWKDKGPKRQENKKNQGQVL